MTGNNLWLNRSSGNHFEWTAKTPGKLTKTKGFKQLMKSYGLTDQLVVETLEKIIGEKKLFEGGIKTEIASTYNKWPQKEHIALFRKKGFEFI